MAWGSACFLPDPPLSCHVGTQQSRGMQDPSPTEKGKVGMKKGAEGGSRELAWVWGYHGRGACRPHVHISLQQGPSTPEPRPSFFSQGLPWVTPGPEMPIPLSHHIKNTGHELVSPEGSARGASHLHLLPYSSPLWLKTATNKSRASIEVSKSRRQKLSWRVPGSGAGVAAVI